MYDVIIIGAGPAGFTAGIYAARREMKTLIIGREPGGQMIWASEIENYPGFKKIQSHELISQMVDQVVSLGIEIKTAEVMEIQKENNYFVLKTSTDKFEAKTIIIAAGLMPRKLDIPGEKEFLGKGVTYCANCDGPFYKNKIVAVVGGGNAALDAAEILSKIASIVYLVHRRDEFRGFEALVDEVKKRPNIELVLNSAIREIKGDQKVQRILVENFSTRENKEIDVDGVFIEIGRTAHTDLAAKLVDRNERNEILVNERCETSCPGIFAAGDVTQVPFKQITVACGQGTIAALAAYQYIQMQKGEKINIILDRSIKK